MIPPIHVCILTTQHPVDDVRVYEKFCRSFLDAGFRVTWVGPDRDFFGQRPATEGEFLRILFPAGRTRLQRLGSYRQASRLAAHVSDVQVYYTPEPDAALAAVRLARRKKARVIFDIHEMYHGFLLGRYLGSCAVPWVREFVRRRIVRIGSQCDLLVGVSDAVLNAYASGDQAGCVVRSCARKWFGKLPPAEVCGQERKNFTVMHGKTHHTRGTFPVLEALAQAGGQVTGLRAIMLEQSSAGSGCEAEIFRQRVRELRIEDVIDLRPTVPMPMMPALLRTCDAGLIAYGRELGVDSLPNRLFEYMAAGLPVIASEYSPEIVKIVRVEKCGLLADFEQPQSVAQAIVYLAQHADECRAMGQRARVAFEQRHNWDGEVRPVLQRIHDWCAVPKGREL